MRLAERRTLYVATNMELLLRPTLAAPRLCISAMISDASRLQDCSDMRLAVVARMLSTRAVRTVCAKEALWEALAVEGQADGGATPAAEVQRNYFASLVEQEVAARAPHLCRITARAACVRSDSCGLISNQAHTFVGSKYSTWTDTVRGMRLAAGKPASAHHLFEELWALGVK